MNELLQHLVDALSLGGLTALVAIGVALVVGILGLVNFAHGELLMVAGFTLLLSDVIPFALAVPVALAASVAAALAMERFGFRPLRDADPATLLIASFAIAYLLQSVANSIFGGRAKSIALPGAFSGNVELLGIRISSVDLITLVTAVVLLSALGVFLRRTTLGIEMRAAAEDFRMARLAGIRANRVIAAGFAIGGLLAGFAGILLAAKTGTVTPEIGLNPLLLAFVAMVIGGLGSLSGAVIGGFALGIATTFFGSYMPEGAQPFRDAFVFGAVIVFLLFLPHGLRGESLRAERV